MKQSVTRKSTAGQGVNRQNYTETKNQSNSTNFRKNQSQVRNNQSQSRSSQSQRSSENVQTGSYANVVNGHKQSYNVPTNNRFENLNF